MSTPTADARRWEVEFDSAGGRIGDGDVVPAVAGAGVRDLFVFSHGWNNSHEGARDLYHDVFGRIAAMLAPERQRTTGFVGVLWPSLLFPEDGPADPSAPDRTTGTGPSSGAQLSAALAPKFPGQETTVHELGALLDSHAQSGAELETFHQLATSLVTTPATGGDEDNGEMAAVTADAHTAISEMAKVPDPTQPAPSDAQGFDLFDTLWRGARQLLRTTTYYEMKSRAGVVGRTGLGELLTELQQANDEVRIHLMGHSFGARLVSFSLAGLPDGTTAGNSPVKSLLLIQGAFSHFAFADHLPDSDTPGALAAVRGRVDGPLLSTYSVHDRAVGLWYPNASLLAGQDNQAADEFLYRWGGMGHDGYQQPDVVSLTLQPHGERYQLENGAFYRLDGRDVIKADQSPFSGAHSDIRNDAVAWAALSAAGLAEH